MASSSRLVGEIKKSSFESHIVGEYNYSISAALKNCIDWASRGPKGNLFNDKPAAIVGAGGGEGTLRAQMHFRDIALFINLLVMNKPELRVQLFSGPPKFDSTGSLVDADTEKRLADVVTAFDAWMKRTTKSE